MTLFKTIGSVFGIGYLPKGGGSVAAAAYCFLMILLGFQSAAAEIICLLIVLAAGVWSASEVEKQWGTDSSKVVIDEVAGMMISLLFVPKEILYVIVAFVLFRFFDIVKPLGIRRMEKFPSGWGVMADDVLSGVYTWILMTVLAELKLL